MSLCLLLTFVSVGERYKMYATNQYFLLANISFDQWIWQRTTDKEFVSFLCFPFNGNSIPIIPHCGLFYLEVQYVQELFLMNATPNIQYQTFFAESYRSCTPAKHLVTCVLLYCSDNLIGGSVVDIYITIKIKIIVIVTTYTEILIRVNRMYIMFIFRVRKYSFTKKYLVIQLYIQY